MTGESRTRELGTTAYTVDVPYVLHRSAEPDGSLLVALHGQGMSAESFAAEALACAPPGAHLLVPQGPLPFEIRRPRGIRRGNGWYVYTGDNDEFRGWLARTEEWLTAVVQGVATRTAVDPRAVDLLGFSQGGYLAGWVGLRQAAPFRRLVVAGARIKHEALAAAARALPGSFSVLSVHGRDDESVDPSAARESSEALLELGVDARFAEFDGGHRVLRQAACTAAVREFLAR